ncbi:hypothetical protein OXB_1726 [Bacillus sp. OxB-1]|nr:hypothetical protein OXB_1726 [Bacillus sp. OxB-1]
MQSFKKVKEASYLSAEKAWSYRAILRYFYVQHERMRDFLFPEEVLAHLQGLPEFHLYTEEQVQQDLAQLVQWNNLVARQEMGRAQTIEEFKKKRFRYQCTAYTVEFERMLSDLEKGGNAFGGSLEKKEFERLYERLQLMVGMVGKGVFTNADECAQLWTDVFTYFRSITKNTSDYIAYISSEEVEERMQTDAFLLFKDRFTSYLRDFIIGLQQTALKIQTVLEELTVEKLLPFFEQVIAHQEQVPRFEDIALDSQAMLVEHQQKWISLQTWFLGSVHGESELESLRKRTNEQIRRITRVVQRLGERNNYFRSRKKDYMHLAEWFDSLESMEDAHRLSSAAFGIFHTKHLHTDHVPTEDIYADVWDEMPGIHEIKPRIRQYREKTRPGAVVSRKGEQAELVEAYLAERRAEQEVLSTYIRDGEIRLETIPHIEPHMRKLLLNWVAKSMTRKDRIIKTEQGYTVRVLLDESKRIELKSEDGVLIMPAAVFQFVEGGE